MRAPPARVCCRHGAVGCAVAGRRRVEVRHTERRLLPDRHRTVRAAGDRGDVALEGARAGRPRARARLRRAAPSTLDRARRDAHVRVERSRRRSSSATRSGWASRSPTSSSEAGVQSGADQLKSTSFDGWTSGTPVAAIMDGRDAMLAFAMNGEPLPIEHGFPVRMVVPGLYGYVSATKWVVDLELTTFADFDAYWARRGWAQQAPIKTQSRIDVPEAARAGHRRADRGRRRRMGATPRHQRRRSACRRRRVAGGGPRRPSGRSTRGGSGRGPGTQPPATTRSKCARPTRTETSSPRNASRPSPTARPDGTPSSCASVDLQHHPPQEEPPNVLQNPSAPGRRTGRRTRTHRGRVRW